MKLAALTILLALQIGTPATWAKTAKVPVRPELHVGYLKGLPSEDRPLIFDNGHTVFTLKPSVYQRNHTRIRFHTITKKISLVFGPKDILKAQPSSSLQVAGQ